MALGSAELQLRELRQAAEHGEPVLAVHYGCEDLYRPKDGPAAVACIALAKVDDGSSVAFSLLDPPPDIEDTGAREVDFLEQFYEHLQSQPEVMLLHWNMNNSTYGFTALATRYRYLTGHDPTYQPPAERAYDLDNLISHQFGENYVPHRKLPNLAALNGISKRHVLAGKEEAKRYPKDIQAIRSSVSAKARIIGELFVRLARGELVTQSSVGSVAFADARLDAVQTVLNIGDRLVYVKRSLAIRRKGRAAIRFVNEYDDQYLVRALLKVFFEDVRDEVWTPSYAGGSARLDFLLPDLRLALELKHTRKTMNDRELGDQLIVDRDRYSASGQVNHLICLVLDQCGVLRNPRGLEEDLARAASQKGLAVTVRIFDR